SRELAEIYTSVPIDMNLDAYTTAPVDEGAAFALLSKLEMSSIIKRLGLTAVQNTDSIPESSTMPAVKPLKISDDIDKLLTLTQTDKLLFVLPVYINNGNDISALGVCCNNIIYLIDDTNARFTELYTAVLKSNNPKITYDCKALYNLCFAKDFTVKNIIFDILLAAYLLSANSGDYSPAILSGEYKVNWAVEQSFSQEHTALVENLAQITALYPIMEKEITVNKQDKLLHEIEIPLSKVLSSMERIGFLIDKQGIKQYGDMINQKLTEHEKEIYNYSGTEFNINSPKQLGEILFEKLELPAKKKTKTGYSTNADVLEYLKPYHPIIPEILEYRKLAKLKSTYIEGLLKVIADDGRIHTHLNQTDTKTGRLSSSEPNMQNIPVRTEIGSQLRRFFIADKGNLLVDADYSQIELRVLAHISKDENMIEAFQNDEDIHTNTAAQVFDLPPLFITPEMRSKAKAVNFGIVYGIGAFSLSQDIGVTVKEADNYIKGYLNTYPGVKQYMADIIAFAKENGYVTTLFNRRRYLPEISATNKNMQAFGQRVAMNTPIQGTAADIIKIAMVRVYNRLEREGLKSKLILQIHDELIIEAPLDEVDIAAKLVREEMQTAIDLSVHLDVDIGSGKSWYDAK
ncbi:MAG: DNA polymerase I, partial [Oscillospiraceae bacterium]